MASASAPAKVILFGEHAVVYGQPAIAVPISSLRVTADVQSTTLPGGGVRLIAADLDVQFTTADGSDPRYEALLLTLRLASQAMEMALPDLEITLHSDIPIASGLGSGAAVAAAIARALGMATGKPFDNATLNALVFEVEKIHHGTPSGIDNTVIVYEKPVYFVRDAPIAVVSIARPFTLLNADTGQRALTRDAVGDVRKLYEAHPERVGAMMRAIGAIARRARESIETGDIQGLGGLMNENQQFLSQLTVSSLELDRLIRAANDAGALGAKLSGGGRGGNMIALVRQEAVEAVSAALYDAGAARVVSTVVGSEN